MKVAIEREKNGTCSCSSEREQARTKFTVSKINFGYRIQNTVFGNEMNFNYYTII